VRRSSPRDTPLHRETRGSGAPIVLLHGWGLNVRVWDALAELLAGRHEVVALDLPGHGRSPWSASCASIEAQAGAVLRSIVPGERVTLLGWSLGGQVALQAAALAPERIERLVLVAATPSFAARPGWDHGARPEVLEKLGRGLASDYERTVTEFLELQVRGSADAHAVLLALRAAVFSHGEARPEALAAGLALLGSVDLRPLLPQIRQPTLVVAGQYDRVTHPSASRELAQQLPDARFVEVRRAGHAPFLSHRDRFAAELLAFVDEARTADAAG
jgi:pimeloyl-[acyl-carrier protein] methyl ester esterase